MEQLLNGDCLELMKKIPDESIELVLMDPPYNISKAKWDKVDNYTEFMMQVLAECERSMKPNGTLIFWHNQIDAAAEIICELKKNSNLMFNSMGIWHKPYFRALAWKNTNGNCTLRSWFNTCEYFFVFTNSKASRTEWDKTGLERVKLDVNNFSTLRKYAFDLLCYIGGGHSIQHKTNRK